MQTLLNAAKDKNKSPSEFVDKKLAYEYQIGKPLMKGVFHKLKWTVLDAFWIKEKGIVAY